MSSQVGIVRAGRSSATAMQHNPLPFAACVRGRVNAYLVAESLGMCSVILGPFAGTLSVLGMGLAEIRTIRQHQFQRPLEDLDQASTIIDGLIEDARAEVRAQGVDDVATKTLRQAHLRYSGSHRTLSMNLGTREAMHAAFEVSHRAHFGLDVVLADMSHVQENAEISVKRVISALKDGNFTYPMDGGAEIKVNLKVDHQVRSLLRTSPRFRQPSRIKPAVSEYPTDTS